MAASSALSGANFRARAGEVHALLGENGAGKSTFIQILAGAVRHDAGTILLNGKAVSRRQPDARRRRAGIAAVFQELSLIPDLTVEQNIWFRHEPLTPLGTVRQVDAPAEDGGLFERLRASRRRARTSKCGG